MDAAPKAARHPALPCSGSSPGYSLSLTMHVTTACPHGSSQRAFGNKRVVCPKKVINKVTILATKKAMRFCP